MVPKKKINKKKLKKVYVNKDYEIMIYLNEIIRVERYSNVS